MPIHNTSVFVPSTKVRNSTVQSIPNNVFTVLNWNQWEWRNDEGMYTPGTPRLVATVKGFYDAGAFCRFNSTAAVGFALALVKNGTVTFAIDRRVGGAGASPIGLICATTVFLDEGDYIQALAYQNTGAALDTFADSIGPNLYLNLHSYNV